MSDQGERAAGRSDDHSSQSDGSETTGGMWAEPPALSFTELDAFEAQHTAELDAALVRADARMAALLEDLPAIEARLAADALDAVARLEEVTVTELERAYLAGAAAALRAIDDEAQGEGEGGEGQDDDEGFGG
jgi:hypothetical protein